MNEGSLQTSIRSCKRAFARLDRLFWPLVVFLSFLLLVRALELRIPEMARPFWEDEVHHNEPILSSVDMAALERRSMYRSMFQPTLDFWVRHEVWFPLLGANERAMRIPALVYGLLLVLLVYGLLIGFFTSHGPRRWAPLLAFVAAFWIVDNPMQVHYATEARHYSFIALASTLWCALLLLYDGKPRWLFAVASLLFANTHFFALPVVAGGYGLQVIREIRARRYGWIAFHFGACFLIYESIVRFSWVPLHWLLTQPPDGKVEPLSAMFTLPALRAGLDVSLDYLRVLNVPPATWLVLLILVIVAIRRRDFRWVPPLLAMCLVLPAFFMYMQFRSLHPVQARYFSAFFGLGLITLIAGLDLVLTEWRLIAPRLAARRRTLVVSALLVAFLFSFGAPAFAYHLFADGRNIHSVPKNGSSYFLAYSQIAREEKPLLIVFSKCFTSDSANLYLKLLLPPREAPSSWVELRCGNGRAYSASLRTIKRFLSSQGPRGGVVILDGKDTDCTEHPIGSFPDPIRVEKEPAISCMWKVTGARTPTELSDVASALGFEAARDIR